MNFIFQYHIRYMVVSIAPLKTLGVEIFCDTSHHYFSPNYFNSEFTAAGTKMGMFCDDFFCPRLISMWKDCHPWSVDGWCLEGNQIF